MVSQMNSDMKQINDDSSTARELLSIYMDGELPVEQRDGLLHQVKGGGTVRADWAVYHCIGDVLRSDDTAYLSPSFALKMRSRLDAEPFLFTPEVAKAYAVGQARPPGRWRMPMAAAASVAAVLTVGSMVLPWRDGGTQQPLQSAQVPSGQAPLVSQVPPGQLALAPAGVVATVPPHPVLQTQVTAAAPASGADGSLRAVSNEYLMAHRNYSNGLAMRGVVSHVRTAGYDGK